MTAPQAPRENWKHGKAIQDGVLRYVSASALQLGDSSTDNGCARRHFYAYARGFKDPPSKATERGAALHTEVEKFLLTGDRAGLSSTVLTGMPILPTPGRDLWVEHDILLHPDDEMVARDAEMLADQYASHDPEKAAIYRQQALQIRLNASLDTAQIRAAGIPVVGKIDCMHRRGVNKGGSDITDTRDPDGTIEVLDWKFVKNLNYAKTPSELHQTIQMALYGKYAYTVFRDAPSVRLSLGYVPASGNPRKVTARVSRDQVDETWNRVEALAGYLRDAAKANDPDAIEANTRACNSYGRPCPASGVCRAAMTNSLAGVVGVKAAENLLKKIRDKKANKDMTTPAKPTGFGSLGARLGGGKPATVSAAPNVVPTITPEEVAREKARLAKQAVLAKHPGLDALVQSIVDCGLGFPTMVGDAATPVGMIRNQAPFEYKGVLKLEGDGELSQFEIPTIEELNGVLADVQAEVASRAAGSTLQERVQAAAEVAPPMIVPPETPESTHTVKTEAPKPTTAAEEIAAQAEVKPKKTRGPKKTKPAPTTPPIEPIGASDEVANLAARVEFEPGADAGENFTRQAVVNAINAGALRQPETTGAINLYVNCAYIEGVDTIDLMPLVDKIVADLNATVEPELDFRYVPERHAMAFGKWRPILSALLRESGIAPGNYRLNGFLGVDILQCIVETMRTICRASGGAVIFGAR